MGLEADLNLMGLEADVNLMGLEADVNLMGNLVYPETFKFRKHSITSCKNSPLVFKIYFVNFWPLMQLIIPFVLMDLKL